MHGLLKRLVLDEFYAQAYSDEGLILVRDRFSGVVCNHMQYAHRKIGSEAGCERNLVEKGDLPGNPKEEEVEREEGDLLSCKFSFTLLVYLCSWNSGQPLKFQETLNYDRS
ncbi:hypothetical protein JTB14_024163 [Gonioctena quinquepunctata]|nr:hypothetical protein JTB14_024163 [Gonioctena quinquepunctata]